MDADFGPGNLHSLERDGSSSDSGLGSGLGVGLRFCRFDQQKYQSKQSSSNRFVKARPNVYIRPTKRFAHGGGRAQD